MAKTGGTIGGGCITLHPTFSSHFWNGEYIFTFVFCFLFVLGFFFLPLDKKGKLETDITKEELYIALNSMKNRKVPGIDRLRQEIYMTFWDLLRSHLGEIINEMKLKWNL